MKKILNNSILKLVFSTILISLLIIGGCSSDDGGSSPNITIDSGNNGGGGSTSSSLVITLSNQTINANFTINLDNQETFIQMPNNLSRPTKVTFSNAKLPSGVTIKDANSGSDTLLTSSGTLTVADRALKVKVTKNGVVTTNTITLIENLAASGEIYKLVFTIANKDYRVDFNAGQTTADLLLPAGIIIPQSIPVKELVYPQRILNIHLFDKHITDLIKIDNGFKNLTYKNQSIKLRILNSTVDSTYTVNIRAISQDALINRLILTINNIAYSNIAFTAQSPTTSGATIPLTTALPNPLTATLSNFAISARATAVDANNNTSIVEGNTVTINGSAINIAVTAEDKTTTRNHVVTLIPFDGTKGEINSLTLVMSGKDYVPMFGTPQTRPDGIISNYAKLMTSELPNSKLANLKAFTYSGKATAKDLNANATIMQGHNALIGNNGVNDFIDLQVVSFDKSTTNLYHVLVLPQNLDSDLATTIHYGETSSTLTMTGIAAGVNIDILVNATDDANAATKVGTLTATTKSVPLTGVTETTQRYVYARLNGVTSAGIQLPINTLSASRFPVRRGHTSVVFKDKMWVIAGINDNSLNDVWSSTNGLVWSNEGTAQFTARAFHSSVVFNDRMWVIAGNDDNNLNDVWSSSDGKTWNREVANAQFPARRDHNSVVFNNKIWVIGGGAYNTDIWSSSDGATWAKQVINASNDFTNGYAYPQSVVKDGRIWITGGNSGTVFDAVYKKGVWSSGNASNWMLSPTNDVFPPRSQHSSVVFQKKIWVIAGDDGNKRNDVWSSTDGVSWTRTVTDGNTQFFSRRNLHTSVVFDGKIWVMGGYANTKDFNDVWYSEDGQTWTRIGAPDSTGNLQIELTYAEGSAPSGAGVSWSISN